MMKNFSIFSAWRVCVLSVRLFSYTGAVTLVFFERFDATRDDLSAYIVVIIHRARSSWLCDDGMRGGVFAV